MKKMLNDLAGIANCSVLLNKYEFDNIWRAGIRIDSPELKLGLEQKAEQPEEAVKQLHARVIAHFNNGLKELSMRLIEGPSAE